MASNHLAQDDMTLEHPAAPAYSSAVPVKRDRPAEPVAPPAATGHPGVDDLTWLAYRAAEALGEAFNKVSPEAGLADLRDWLVLALISSDDAQRTQLEIATQLGIDKSTLVPLLDRLERDGLIVRATSERDRRVRIPKAHPPASRSPGKSPSPGTRPSTTASPPSPRPSGPASTQHCGASWRAQQRRSRL